MTSAWFLGAAQSVPQDESKVRSTVEPIRTDSISAEIQHEPDWNERTSDDSGELVGLAPRDVAGDTHDSEKYVPSWLKAATTNHNAIIDDQVSSSGTAAAREAAGIQGHGTMQYSVAIEPVIRDGAAFGNEFFQANPAGIQEGAGAYMTPVGSDSWNAAVAQAHAEERSRQAFNASLYENLWK